MANLMRSNYFQLNSDYYSKCQQKMQDHRNIYLGGTKQANFSKSYSKKGISLTKSLSTNSKLSNKNYLQKTTPEVNQTHNLESSKMILPLKLNFPSAVSKIPSSQIYTFTRAYSTPLIVKFHNNCDLKSKIQILGKNRFIKRNQFLQKARVKIGSTQCNFSHTSMDYFPMQMSSPVSSGNLCKFQYSGSIEKLRINPQSRKKIMLVSPDSKALLSSKAIYQSDKGFDSRLSSTNYSSKTIQLNENIYLQKLSQCPQQKRKDAPLQTSPFKSVTTIRPTTPFPKKRQSMQLSCRKVDINMQVSNEYESFPSLKHSKSTAEQRQSPDASNQLLSEESIVKIEENVHTSPKSRVLKQNVKSLWDSVDKCTVSLIYEESELVQKSSMSTAFNQINQKAYNELGQGTNFNSWVIQKFPAEQFSEIN